MCSRLDFSKAKLQIESWTPSVGVVRFFAPVTVCTPTKDARGLLWDVAQVDGIRRIYAAPMGTHDYRWMDVEVLE